MRMVWMCGWVDGREEEKEWKVADSDSGFAI